MAQNNRPYVLWRRVSTKQQGESKLGLQAQTAIALHFMGTEPVKTFTDIYSGTKLKECRNLRAAINYCKATGYLLVVAKTDRFRDTKDGLDILDEIGEHNLSFCDMPYPDRTILTMMFSMWERQAIMGRINTKLALNVRKEYQRKGQTWISKTGRECNRLGRPADGIDEHGKPYWDLSAANEASCRAKHEAAILWREQSKAVMFARRKRAEGWGITRITEELGQLFDDNATYGREGENPYGTPRGCRPTQGTVSAWCRGMNPLAV